MYFLAFRPGLYQQKYHHDVLMCGLDSVRAAWFWIQVAIAEHNLQRLESRFEEVLRGIASPVAFSVQVMPSGPKSFLV